MQVPGKRDHDDALLSLDFVSGFTIFMIALIFVVLMVSGLLVYLQSRTIDYDAVAYRTSVILVEDPGEPAWVPFLSYNPSDEKVTSWNLVNIAYPPERARVRRLGLAVSKEYPEILDYYKVEKFFDGGSPPGCYIRDQLCNPGDYREKILFGDYPYQFNITLNTIPPGELDTKTIGPVPPDITGYVRRLVKVKLPSRMEIIYNQSANISNLSNNTTVSFNFPDLYSEDARFRVDPLNQDVTINFTNLNGPTIITDITICTRPMFSEPTCFNPFSDSPTIVVINQSNAGYFNRSVVIERGYFQRINLDEFSEVNITITFSSDILENLQYNYTSSGEDVEIPPLIPAVIEVRVW